MLYRGWILSYMCVDEMSIHWRDKVSSHCLRNFRNGVASTDRPSIRPSVRASVLPSMRLSVPSIHSLCVSRWFARSLLDCSLLRWLPAARDERIRVETGISFVTHGRRNLGETRVSWAVAESRERFRLRLACSGATGRQVCARVGAIARPPTEEVYFYTLNNAGWLDSRISLNAQHLIYIYALHNQGH